jgi:hypothetical protein
MDESVFSGCQVYQMYRPCKLYGSHTNAFQEAQNVLKC